MEFICDLIENFVGYGAHDVPFDISCVLRDVEGAIPYDVQPIKPSDKL